jgi:hypothetical protein
MLFVILGTLWFSTSFLSSASIANEGVSEEYVYLLKSEGGKIYRITEKTTGNTKGLILGWLNPNFVPIIWGQGNCETFTIHYLVTI